MWKHILTIMIFLLTASCASKEVTTVPSLGAHFPQTNNQIGNTDSLVRGELVLDNGCLRVNGANTLMGDSFLLIWNSTFSTRTEQEVVQVIDSSTGEVLASVGDYVEVGGGIAPIGIEESLKEPIPSECPRPYWLVGESVKKVNQP